MKRISIGCAAIAAIALNGCIEEAGAPAPAPSDPAASAFKSIYTFDACAETPTDGNIAGTINIVLPRNFNGAQIQRKVNQASDGPPNIPRNDPRTGENGPPFSPNSANAAEPFDVFMDTTGIDPTNKRFVSVRIIVPNGAQWSFYEQGNFYGVGPNVDTDQTLCGSEPVIAADSPGPNQAGSIAGFYVDLEVAATQPVDYEVPFTIGIVTKAAGPQGVGVPILIDPKMRNLGGGSIRN